MINRMAISALGVSAALLVGTVLLEGYRDTTYLDSVGVPTIGPGRTEGVKPGQRTTVERELVLLLEDLDVRKREMAKCVTAPLYQWELEAYMKLAYNVGTSAFCESSIPEKLNSGQYEAACKTILDFDQVRDCRQPKVYDRRRARWVCPLVPLRGLTLRRHAEYKTCMGQDSAAASLATADR